MKAMTPTDAPTAMAVLFFVFVTVLLGADVAGGAAKPVVALGLLEDEEDPVHWDDIAEEGQRPKSLSKVSDPSVCDDEKGD
jgi:hypothetical protein